MTAVLQRLHAQLGYDLKESAVTHNSQWEFTSFLNQQKSPYFEILLKEHVILNIEYSIYCTKLANRLLSQKPIANSEEITEQVAAALVMAELLAHLYRHYLSVPREVKRLEDEKKIYCSFLRKRGYQFPSQQELIPSPGFFAQKVRDTTAFFNWPRLFSGRIRRVFTTVVLIPQIQELQYFSRFVLFADRYVNPALTYFSWLFYVPRLATNLFLLLKHLIPGKWWMSEQERSLSWQLRLHLQVQRRWFELGNDGIFFTSGLLNCFVLTGALAPIAMYVIIALFLFDALWTGLRAYVELGRLNHLENYYAAKRKELEARMASPAEIAELSAYQEALRERVLFERSRLLLPVMSNTVLFISMLLALPFLTTPILGFIGAMLVATVTCVAFMRTQQLEKIRPANRIMELSQPKYGIVSEGFFPCPNRSLNHVDPEIKEQDPALVLKQ
nr:hypothetical protein [Legionella jordanis]